MKNHIEPKLVCIGSIPPAHANRLGETPAASKDRGSGWSSRGRQCPGQEGWGKRMYTVFTVSQEPQSLKVEWVKGEVSRGEEIDESEKQVRMGQVPHQKLGNDRIAGSQCGQEC